MVHHLFTIHGVGNNLDKILLDRIKGVENEAYLEFHNQLNKRDDIEFLSLGGVRDTNNHPNSMIAYNYLKHHKEGMPKNSKILHLNGLTFLEECSLVVEYVFSKGLIPAEINSAIENTPLRKFRLKLSYRLVLNLYKYKKYLEKISYIYFCFGWLIFFIGLFGNTKNIKINIKSFKSTVRPLSFRYEVIALILLVFDPMFLGLEKFISKKIRK